MGFIRLSNLNWSISGGNSKTTTITLPIAVNRVCGLSGSTSSTKCLVFFDSKPSDTEISFGATTTISGTASFNYIFIHYVGYNVEE